MVRDKVVDNRLQEFKYLRAPETGLEFLSGFEKKVGPQLHVAAALLACSNRASIGLRTRVDIRDIDSNFPRTNRQSIAASLLGKGCPLWLAQNVMAQFDDSYATVVTDFAVSAPFQTGIGMKQGAITSVVLQQDQGLLLICWATADGLTIPVPSCVAAAPLLDVAVNPFADDVSHLSDPDVPGSAQRVLDTCSKALAELSLRYTDKPDKVNTLFFDPQGQLAPDMDGKDVKIVGMGLTADGRMGPHCALSKARGVALLDATMSCGVSGYNYIAPTDALVIASICVLPALLFGWGTVYGLTASEINGVGQDNG